VARRKRMASNGDTIAEMDPPEQAPATDAGTGGVRRSAAAVASLLRGFLAVQQRRAEAYSLLRRYNRRAPVCTFASRAPY
jgi:hypothetical protein